VSLSIDSQSAVFKDIETLKRHLKSKGYATKVVTAAVHHYKRSYLYA
jgi:hypothetical protein